MPNPITDSDVFTDPLQMPIDGEVVDASDFLSTTVQGLANRTRNNRNRIATLEELLSDITVPVPLVPTANQDTASGGSARFTWTHIALGRGLVQSSVASVGYLVFPFPLLPPGAVTIVEAKAHLLVLTGRGGFTFTKPTLAFDYVPLSTGVPVLGTPVADASANLTAYETVHSITLPIARTISASERYWLRFTGENGADAAADKLTLFALEITVSP
jgi:hypothetical protein